MPTAFDINKSDYVFNMEINANHAENFVLKYSLLSSKQVKIAKFT